VELKQIHVVGAQVPQRVVEAVDHLRGRPQSTLLPDLRLGRDHHAIARQFFDRLADDRLGVVGRCGIEEIDPEVERAADQGDRFGLALAPGPAQPAAAAAAEAGDADPKAGPAERRVLHRDLRGCAAAGQLRTG
jgi:hypothetical protein